VSLPDLSARRPITVLMATLAVVVFGVVASGKLPVELLPDLAYPTLTVQTRYPDAAPTSVEQFVTRPIEESVGVIPGVRKMWSVSRAGLSEVVLEFGWSESMDFAVLDVREKLGLVRLPEEAELPRVLRYDPSLDPVIRLALHGDRGLDGLRQVADRWLKPRLEAIEGIAAAKVRGGLEPEILVEADEDRLAALGLTLQNLSRALRAENVNRPGGTIKDWGAVYLVRTLHEFDDLEQLRRTVVRDGPDGRVRVEDVAEVTRGHRDREVITRSDGREAIEIALHREGSANTLSVAEAVRGELSTVRTEMSPDLTLELLADQSRYIGSAIDEVWSAAFLGGILALIVLFFFLRDLPSTLIISLTIPVSVIATFLPMYRAGVTLNIMSLGGLALGVGMLVDNSIVVLEAIDRRRREGRSRFDAAVRGASDVAGAVTAATLTTVSVFLPIVFVQGIAGQLFYDLAVTVCLSLVASLLVSLTLIPALAARSLTTGEDIHAAAARPTLFRWNRGSNRGELPMTLRLGPVALPPIGDGRHWLSRILTVALLLPRLVLTAILGLAAVAWIVLARVFGLLTWPLTKALDGLNAAYPGTLRGALRIRWLVLASGIALLALSLMQARNLGTDLVPSLAQGEFAFRVELPEGTPLESTAEIIERIESRLIDDPRFEKVFSVIGNLPSAASGRRSIGENLARIDITLPEGTDAEAEARAVSRVRDVLRLFDDVDAELVRSSVLTLQPPVEVHLFSDDLEQLDVASARLAGRLEGLSSVRDVASTAEPGSPEIRVELDRERAAALGVSAEQAGAALRRQIHGELVGTYREKAERLDIRVRAASEWRERASEIADLRVQLPGGSSVPVSAFASVEISRGPAAIHRAGGARVARITGENAGGDLGRVLADVRREVRRTDFGPSVVAELSGQDEELEVSFGSLRLALVLALFLVYVVMAVQFESLRHPFVILLSVPLGLIGVIGALWITGTALSVLALIGVVMLAGIVVNNAIVLVDAINRRRRQGQPLDEAIVEAGNERLRPILMTTTTTVLALLPMAIGLGAGNELRAPLAITVIGGLLVSTLLTLIVIPSLYRVVGGSLRSTGETDESSAAGLSAHAAGESSS
jgi:HAE1 family hydrophobic/amphiphilic exporter-1